MAKEVSSICIANRSTLIPDEDVERVAMAIRKQIANAVARYWPVNVDVVSCGKDDQVPFRMWPLFVYDEAMQTNDILPVGACGAHDMRGTPVGAISIKQCKADNIPWSQTASHEAIEMAINPSGAIYRLANNRMWLQDICNPCATSYVCDDGVELSNFVTPAWFSLISGRRLDFTSRVLIPLTPETGGYAPSIAIGQASSGV